MKDSVKMFCQRLLLLFGCVMCGVLVRGQAPSLLDKRISIQVHEQSVSQALEQIERAADLHFSYNSRLFNRTRKISVSLENRSVKQILKIVLRDPTLRFNETEQEIIIYRPANLEAASQAFWNEELARSKSQTTKPKDQTQAYDTIVRYQVVVDTVLDSLHIAVFDTNRVEIRDTLLDTVRVSHSETNLSVTMPLWSLQAGGQVLFPSVAVLSRLAAYSTDVAQLHSQEQQQPSMGAFAMLRLAYGGLCLSTGLRYAILQSNYNFALRRSWIDSSHYSSSYDTVVTTRLNDSYYEYTNQGDTVWHHNYVRDISISEKRSYKSDSIAIQKHGSMQIHLLQIPLMLGYSKSIGKTFRLEAGGGLITNIVFAAKGSAINANTRTLELSDAASMQYAKPFWSICAQTQAVYQITPRCSVLTTLFVDHCLQSVYAENILISRKYTNIGVQVGVEVLLTE